MKLVRVVEDKRKMPALQSVCDSSCNSIGAGRCRVCDNITRVDYCLCEKCYISPHCCRKCGKSLVRVQKLKDENISLAAKIKKIEEENLKKRAEVFASHIELANLVNQSKPKPNK